MRHWYARYQLSNAVDDGTLAACLAQGHAARCSSCQVFARDLAALHARLSGGAAEAPIPVRARRPRWLLVAAPLALGATAAIAISLGTRAPAPAPVVSLQPAALVRDVADRLSAALVSTPLDAELRDLIHDGRRGLDVVLASGGLRQVD